MALKKKLAILISTGRWCCNIGHGVLLHSKDSTPRLLPVIAYLLTKNKTKITLSSGKVKAPVSEKIIGIRLYLIYENDTFGGSCGVI